MKKSPLAIVTGAACRLGRALALMLAQQGYAILLHYYNSSDEAKSTADEIRSLGVPVYLMNADLRNTDQIRSLFMTVDSLKHPLKILVNSAAIMRHVDTKNVSVEDWDFSLDLNLRAPFFIAQLAAERMVDGGLIVNISDAGARKVWTGFPAYTISKVGLETLTRILAKTYAPNIRANAIAPGLVLPPADMSTEAWKKLITQLPLHHSVTLEEIADTLFFLLQNQSITGQTIVVDGGYSLI